MLCLLWALLPWALLCLVSPVPLHTPCPVEDLFKEAMKDLQKLQKSEGSSKNVTLNNVMEAEGNATTYLEGFIETLNKTKQSAEQKLLIRKLQAIQTYGESCTGWEAALKEHHWEPKKKYDFFWNLENFLRFLGHNALP